MKSAIAGCVIGQYNIGYCYANGIGTDKNSINLQEIDIKCHKII
jgi:hypothetical protein